MNNLPLATMAPVTIMGHKVYGVFVEPEQASATTTRRALRSTTRRKGPTG